MSKEIIRYVSNNDFYDYWYGDITWLELLKVSEPEKYWDREYHNKEIKITIPDKKD